MDGPSPVHSPSPPTPPPPPPCPLSSWCLSRQNQGGEGGVVVVVVMGGGLALSLSFSCSFPTPSPSPSPRTPPSPWVKCEGIGKCILHLSPPPLSVQCKYIFKTRMVPLPLPLLPHPITLNRDYDRGTGGWTEGLSVFKWYIYHFSPWYCTQREGAGREEWGGEGHNHFYDTFVNSFII